MPTPRRNPRPRPSNPKDPAPRRKNTTSAGPKGSHIRPTNVKRK